MRVVIAGSSGLIGTALRDAYRDEGDPVPDGGRAVQVVRLVRRPPAAADEVRWDPRRPDPTLVDGADLLINLAGNGIGDRRWTARQRAEIRASRTVTAHALATMAATASRPPSRMLSASGIRYYGIDRGDEPLTEDSPPGPGPVLPATAHAWEAATAPAIDAGVPVCHLRLGLVLSRHGGLLPPLLPWFRLGLGASFATGGEYWSFITLTDAVRAIRFLAGQPDTAGPYNITAPGPVPNRELAHALGRSLGRPVALRLPGWTLRVGLGGIASEVFGGLRVLPARLLTAGFRFEHPDIDTAVAAALR